MSVGAHTVSHPFLASTSDEQAWHEIQQSREQLTRVLGKEVWALAYPFGDPSSAGTREFEMSARSGYECAFMNYGGGLHSEFSRFAIPRVHVTSDMNLGEFEAHVSGFHSRLQQRFGHEVAIPCA
jgi:peptidoglycan/xylan/chitin deacetylase (PgdA/CDA1 family)